MNREIKTSYKKQLIRYPAIENTKGIVVKNTKQVIPSINCSDMEFDEAPESSQLKQTSKKTTFKIPDIDESLRSLTLSPTLKHNSKTDIHANESKKSIISSTSSKLDVPRMHSSLNIGKKIDKLGKMKTSVSSLKTASENRIVDDKILRQVNFPYQKKIYKDLIPLSSPNKYSHTKISSRDPIPPKDREPVLENLIEIKPVEECSYIPNVKLEDPSTKVYCSNLQLYKILRMLEH